MKALLILCCSVIFVSCGYRVMYTSAGEDVIDQKYYTFNQAMSGEDFLLIDTSVVYKLNHSVSNGETFYPQEADYNQYLKFYGDGTFIRIYKSTAFTKSDLNIDKNSTWRGRFVIKTKTIMLEQFYPNQAPDKMYHKKFLKMLSGNGNLILYWDTGDLRQIYVPQIIN